ncbi:MAG: hypothetical protein LBQ60_01315 [Bacteroidales bacterium]|nr:hypothetical protein [Bacteroidales bacterium]
MFEITGIGTEMARLAQLHSALPYLLTIFVAMIFGVFGLYGLSADNIIRKLPLLKPAVFIIAGIYLFRGVGGLIFQQTGSILETIYSLIAVLIGLLFLLGGLKKWKTNETI